MNKVLYVITLVTLLALALSGAALAQSSDQPNPEDLYGSGQKSWQLKEYVLDGKTVTLPDYAQDDRFVFTSAGVGKFDAGTVFKDANVPVLPDAFVWKIEGDRLILSDLESLHPTGKVEFNIVSLTPDEAIVERDYDQDGKTVVLRQTIVPAPESSGATVTATQVIDYAPPAVPAGEAQAGSCWTNSLAASGREDAWRCSVDNAIYDPCFQIPGNSDVVVCNPDPTKNDPGIAMKLTEPLPKPDVPQAAVDAYQNNGWLVQLADGSYCGFMTGATFVLGDDRGNYGCTDGEWYIMGDLQPGTVWKAKMATITMGDNGAELKDSKTADISTVWR
jgi:hypothetical protein